MKLIQPASDCVILGAGGHAKVVLDAYRLRHPGAVVELRDDDREKAGVVVLGIPVRTPIGLASIESACHVAIGDNAARERWGTEILASKLVFREVVHPAAQVCSSAAIGRGAFVAARAVVGPDARVADGAIINHGAIVDHDCTVGAWTHIAPGAILGGEVAIGSSCLVGSGAIILPGVRVGNRTIIGSGAVVTRDVPGGTTILGIPAREIHE